MESFQEFIKALLIEELDSLEICGDTWKESPEEIDLIMIALENTIKNFECVLKEGDL